MSELSIELKSIKKADLLRLAKKFKINVKSSQKKADIIRFITKAKKPEKKILEEIQNYPKIQIANRSSLTKRLIILENQMLGVQRTLSAIMMKIQEL